MKRFALMVLCLLVLSIALAGCAFRGPGAIRGQVADRFGRRISGAEVAVVEVPRGGLDELARRARQRGRLYGWHFTTDAGGEFRLEGIPTGDLPSGDNPPQVYTAESRGPRPDYGPGGHEAGRWLGFVVSARGYAPFVALVRFPSPSGWMGRLTLVSRSRGELGIDQRGVRITLVPLGSAQGAARSAAGAEAESQEPKTGTDPDAVRTRTIEVPCSAANRFLRALTSEPPNWGGAGASPPRPAQDEQSP